MQSIQASANGPPPSVRVLSSLIRSVLLIASLGAILSLLLLTRVAQEHDRTAAEASQDMFIGLTALQARQLATILFEYGHWDETIEHIPSAYDVGWWDDYAGSSSMDSFGLSFSIALDGTGSPRLVSTPEETRINPSADLITPSLRAMFNTVLSQPESTLLKDGTTTGFAVFEDAVHLVAVSRYVPEFEDSPPNPDPNALLVFGRSISGDLLSEIDEIMGFPGLRLVDAEAGAGSIVPLLLADGHVGGAIAWSPQRPGLAMAVSLIVPLFLSFLAVTILVTLFVRRGRRLALELHADNLAKHQLALRNQLILESAGEGIFGVNDRATAVFVNPAALNALGYSANEFIDLDPQTVISSHQNAEGSLCSSATWRLLHEVLTYGEPRTSDNEMFVRRNGSRFPVEYLITPVTESNQVTGAVVVFRDVTESRRNLQEISYRANYDSLTELPNRTLLIEHANQQIKLASRNNDQFCLMFIDLDNFKEVNDTLGHDAGDLLLQQASLRLRSCVREVDTVARLGGDEFVILLTQLRTPNNADLIARKIIATFNREFEIDGQEVWIGASIGIAAYPDDGHQSSELMRNADLAMYRAKQAGRNKYRHYQRSMSKQVQERRRLATDLRHAIERAQFCLHYSPVIELRNAQYQGLEALVRWQHPERGLLAAEEFLALAEETGLIADIGKWILNECCRQASEWRMAGYAPDISMTVSGGQVPLGLPLDYIKTTMDRYRLAPETLLFEITETMLLNDTRAVRDWLNGVKALGIRFVIKNFGSGYSSLSRLKEFDVHALKIGQSFITDLLENEDNQTLVEAIINMANGLGVKVVAEGVENREQLTWLRDKGCQYGQGDILASPTEANDIEFKSLIENFK